MATTLRFRADGTFTIAQLTDLHWQNGEPDDLRTSALVGAVLDAERPDLVVLTGDVIAGGGSRDPGWALRQALEPLAARGLPWALVFGNHDDEGSLDRAALLEVARAVPGCLAEAGPADVPGVGNYRLEVHGEGGVGARLYFLDSRGYAPEDVGGYAWVAPAQVAWYLGLPRPAPAPALAFLHIPVPEFSEVWEHQPCRGQRHESVCAPRLNSGLFCAMREVGEVRGVFAGHDHVNDYAGTLYGIRLCYGRATGFQTYGREGMPRGARMIRLRSGSADFESWLRLDGGARVSEGPEHPAG